MPRFDAIACQRLAHTLWRWRVPLLPRLIDAFVIVFWKCSLPHTVAIGRGSHIAYYQPGVVVHRRCVIGENVELHGGVVIGGRKEGVLGVPRIGNNVCIYSGAKILGDITIGDNCVIAANAVVIEDMPPGAMALPPRAQVYPYIKMITGFAASLSPKSEAGLSKLRGTGTGQRLATESPLHYE